ncbi:MAG: SDR family NAD(P)-dependent oxidoreductase [Pirellulales bacterium]
MGRLSGKVALVTGAGRGLGKAAIAIALAKEGATLFLTSRTIVEVEAVAKECRAISGSDAIAWQADVTQRPK